MFTKALYKAGHMYKGINNSTGITEKRKIIFGFFLSTVSVYMLHMYIIYSIYIYWAAQDFSKYIFFKQDAEKRQVGRRNRYIDPS